MQKYHNKEYTKEYINSLDKNEIFVFGSNVEGRHGSGSAKTAIDKFGAIYGQGFGYQGSSYAIATIDLRKGFRSVSLEVINWQIEEMLRFAERNKKMKLYVTKIGTERAGYSIDEISNLFFDKCIPDNVILPIEFVEK